MDRSDITLERMRTFVRVVERGSLSAVAREHGVGQSSVTRHLNELEDAVGVALLTRTTRRLALTDEGHSFYRDSLQVLRLVEQARDDVRAQRDAAAGTVRVSCTAALGVRHVTQLIFAFQDRHPGVAVDLGLTDERIDLVRDGIDIAVRLGPLTDSSMKLRTLGRSRRVLVASPAYLDVHGSPMAPHDLATHQGIRMANVAGSDAIQLELDGAAQPAVAFGGRFRTDHGLAAREALIAARGIAPAHLWLVDDLIADGRLVVVLPDHALSPVPLNMLIPPERARIERVRLLIDFLVERIASIPGIERRWG